MKCGLFNLTTGIVSAVAGKGVRIPLKWGHSLNEHPIFYYSPSNEFLCDIIYKIERTVTTVTN